jgi:AcrR family transcriptional regulator
MKLKDETKKELILDVARKEFLDKGFRDASLREIAQKAKGTTGTIYTYFENKDKIFRNLVNPVILKMEAKQMEYKLSVTEIGMNPKRWFTRNLEFLIGLIEAYPDEMKLLFLKSDGSSLQYYKETLVERGLERSTRAFRQLKRSKDFNGQELSEFFVLNLVRYVINVVIELLKQDKSKEEIVIYKNEITSFLFGGWKALVEF